MLSIIIIVLNNANGLQKNLSEILKQKTDELEIIIIDGGSTDHTLDVIKKFEKDITYWETGLDTCISDAFNRGIRRAKNEFVTFINSDDYWLPQAFNTIKQHLHIKNSKIDIFAFSVMYHDPIDDYFYTRHPNLNAIKFRMTLFHPSMVIRRDYFNKIGLFSTEYKLAMDAEWCHRAIAKGAKFYTSKNVLSVMQLGGKSDELFWLALWEYRKSLIKYKIASSSLSMATFLFLVSIKALARLRRFRMLKRKIIDQ